MSDGIVVVGTKVDLSGLRRGMAEAQIDVRSASADMSSAYKQLGAAARSGSKQAQEALIEQQDALNAAKERVNEFKEAQRAAEAEARRLAAAQREVAGSTRTMTSTFYAAQGASAELRGAIPYRALERFLADIPGVQTALLTAFPVIGALALGQVLVDAGAKAINFYEDVVNLKQAMKDLDELDLSVTGKVKQLGEETEQANIRFIELTQGTEAAAKEKERYAATKPIDLTSFFSSKDFRSLPDEVKKGLENTYKVINPSDLDSKIAQLKGKMTEIQDVISHPEKHRTVTGSSRQGPIYSLPDENLARAQLHIRQQIDKQLEAEAAKHAATMKELSAEVKKAGEESPNALPITAPVVPDKHILEKAAKQLDKAKETAAEQDRRMQESLARSTSSLMTQQDEAVARSAAVWRGYDAELVRSAEIHASVKASMEEAALQFQVQIGALSELAAYEKLATIHAAEYKSQLEQINTAIQQTEGNPFLTPSQRETEAQGLRNRRDQIKGQATITGIEDQSRIAQAALAPWTNAFREMNSQFNSSIEGWLRGTERFSEAFTRMADNMATSFTTNLLHQGELWIEHEAMKLAVHSMTNAGIMAQDQAAAIVASTTSAQSTLAQITHYASLAAAKAYSAMAGIPIIGPELGAIAAGATFAAVEALAAFDKGTSYVPRDGVAMLHRGETVLPPPTSEDLRGMLGQSRRGRGGDNHFHYSPQVNAIDGPSVGAALSKHSQAFQREQWRQLRNMGLVQ